MVKVVCLERTFHNNRLYEEGQSFDFKGKLEKGKQPFVIEADAPAPKPPDLGGNVPPPVWTSPGFAAEVKRMFE